MNYTKEQFIELAKRFNEKSILGKLITIKSNPELFKLHCDNCGRITLRLGDDASNEAEYDLLFDFNSNILEHPEGVKAMFELSGIKLY